MFELHLRVSGAATISVDDVAVLSRWGACAMSGKTMVKQGLRQSDSAPVMEWHHGLKLKTRRTHRLLLQFSCLTP